MILEGHWCAEKRHDAVAHHAADCPFESVNGLDHVLEDGVEDLLASSGSRSAIISVELLMSANSTVTSLRSFSRPDVRILLGKVFGV